LNENIVLKEEECISFMLCQIQIEESKANPEKNNLQGRNSN
jgi:hypothetical protein